LLQMIKKHYAILIGIVAGGVFVALIIIGVYQFLYFLEFLEGLKRFGEQGDVKYGLKANDWIAIYSLTVSAISGIISFLGIIVTGIFSYLIFSFTKKLALKEEKEKFMDSYFKVKERLKYINEYMLGSLLSKYSDAKTLEEKWNFFIINGNELKSISEKVKNEIGGPLIFLLSFQLNELSDFDTQGIINRYIHTHIDEKELFMAECVKIWESCLSEINGALHLYEAKLDKQYDFYNKNKEIWSI
jgi:hypothetical protein